MPADTVAVRAVRDVGENTIAVDLETPDEFDPQPGQFVKLTAIVDGEHIVRFYTMSSPAATDTFEVTVGIEPDGVLGPWLQEAAGETVQIEGPYGRAAYEGEPRSVILASGPGLGAAVGVAERAVADGNDAVIVFVGEDPPHRERLRSLEEAGVDITIAPDGPRLGDDIGKSDQVFVYGFQEFVTEALAVLEDAGVDVGEAKVENYG